MKKVPIETLAKKYHHQTRGMINLSFSCMQATYAKLAALICELDNINENDFSLENSLTFNDQAQFAMMDLMQELHKNQIRLCALNLEIRSKLNPKKAALHSNFK